MRPQSNIDTLRGRGNKLGKISDKLKSAGNFGIYFNKDAIKKKVAETDDPKLEPSEYELLMSYAKTVDPRYKNEKTSDQWNQFFRSVQFRAYLIEKSNEPELDEILDTLTNELVIINQGSRFFAEPKIDKTEMHGVDEEVVKKIEEKIAIIWGKLYRMLNFHNNGAWEKAREHLIVGPLAWEIVYDDLKNPKNIIGIFPVDPHTLTEYWKDGERWWIQTPKFGIHGSGQRVLHDSQIVFVTWDQSWGRISYLHRLIRPFNIARTMERTKINWFVVNSMFRTTNIIPTSGKGRVKAAKTLASAMNRYKDDITFNDIDGTMKVNGSPNIPANKEYWLADTDSGKPEIATVGNDGPDLSSMENLSFFDKRLYKVSKVPYDRFDPSGPETWHMDATSQKRQEINYSNFINRIRDKFSQCLLKPLIIQLCLEMPEIIDDFEIIDNIILEYNQYNVFNELAEMEILSKKVDFCESMLKAFEYTDSQGQVHSYFPRSYIIERYMQLSTEDMQRMEEYRDNENKWKMKLEKDSIKKLQKIQDFQAKIQAEAAKKTAGAEGTTDDTSPEGGDTDPENSPEGSDAPEGGGAPEGGSTEEKTDDVSTSPDAPTEGSPEEEQSIKDLLNK